MKGFTAPRLPRASNALYLGNFREVRGNADRFRDRKDADGKGGGPRYLLVSKCPTIPTS